MGIRIKLLAILGIVILAWHVKDWRLRLVLALACVGVLTSL
jgi:hypothetical protein